MMKATVCDMPCTRTYIIFSNYSIFSTAESAKDPDEWHRFFKETFGSHVTVCTCAVQNDLLLHTLVERRECLRNIELLLEPGESNDELHIAYRAAMIERDRTFFAKMMALVSKGIPEYYARFVSLSGMLSHMHC